MKTIDLPVDCTKHVSPNQNGDERIVGEIQILIGLECPKKKSLTKI